MNTPKPTAIRADDLLRHLQDLYTGTYEGAKSWRTKEELYRRGIELLTPVAVTVLEEANVLFLQGTGQAQVIGPEDDGSGGLETRFELSWPEQRAAHVTRGLPQPLQPVRIMSTIPRTSFILTSLEVRWATGHFKSRVKLLQKGREGYSLPLSNWNCTNASTRQIGEFCLLHSNGNEISNYAKGSEQIALSEGFIVARTNAQKKGEHEVV